MSMDMDCFSMPCSWEEGCLNVVGCLSCEREHCFGDRAMSCSAGSNSHARVRFAMAWILCSVVVEQMDVHTNPVGVHHLFHTLAKGCCYSKAS